MMPSGIKRVGLTVVVLCLKYASAEVKGCDSYYGAGDIAGAVIGTFIVSALLFVAALFIHKWYWRSRKGKHLVLTTDPENPNDQYAFDNPCFREATPVKQSIPEEKTPSKLEKTRWLGWSPLHSFGLNKNNKLTSLDDSYVSDSHLKVVSLKGHDFTGLGFNICGNMRDGIFVKDVLHRGPAFESGCINSGDRIDSVCISFRNMVFEDALTILSYASPYEVQVQVENDSHSRPSTLIRSKRESNAVSSVERIRHPKYNRSQSISHLAEIGKSNNKWYGQPSVGQASEKNRINRSLNKSDPSAGNRDYPTLKISAAGDSKKDANKLVKNAVLKASSPKNIKTVPSPDSGTDHRRSKDGGSEDSKMQKLGIKVLPMSVNPKMGIQSVTAGKKVRPNSPADEGEAAAQRKSPTSDSAKGDDEVDAGKENVKALITKGLHNLKEKINQNSLTRKKSKEAGEDSNSRGSPSPQNTMNERNGRAVIVHDDKTPVAPIPKVRSSFPNASTEPQPVLSASVPEEVTRAGDVARSNRKSVIDPKIESDVRVPRIRDEAQDDSGSDTSSESGYPNATDEGKRPKRSKGKAPAPPRPTTPADDTKSSAEAKIPLVRDRIFEPNQTTEISRTLVNRDSFDAYDSDSDAERPSHDKRNGTKIELSATQVTVHHTPTAETVNDDDIETSRKAASLGDLSKLDSEHTLSVVLERAVSLDLADGSAQCGKKRKAPLPPPEEFPTVFDEMGYRKEPRLENSLGLNTFQRRLKKSSDFGTLEDALQDGPKSLDLEMKKHNDVLEANNTNIQKFSTWLEECRKQKDKGDEENDEGDEVQLDDEDGAIEDGGRESVPLKSTSLVKINMSDGEDTGEEKKMDAVGEYPLQSSSVTFSVNGKNLGDLDGAVPHESAAQANNYTVLVISQPNSLEPVITEGVSMNVATDGASHPDSPEPNHLDEKDSAPSATVAAVEDVPPQLPTSPVPVSSKTTLTSSPLSTSLTYVTEIKVSTSDGEGHTSESPKIESCDRIAMTHDAVEETLRLPPKEEESGVDESPRNSFAELVSRYSPKKNEENSTSVTFESNRKGNEYGGETSRIPIRTMKSETGQKVLATIQSLAAKDSPPKTPEVEYAKRVASLFSTPEGNPKSTGPRHGNEGASGFYLSTAGKKPAPNRKIPPTVPPRKVDGKSSVTVALSGKPKDVAPAESTDRNIITFSSFVPSRGKERENLPKIVNWKENSKDVGDINGGHVRVESGIVHFPVKTSATKIIFENKDLDKEQL